nr:hypothetical protein [Amycolatopsis thermalba]
MRARELWVVLETLHDVTYFAPQAKAAHEAAGLRGFWRGYVGTRAAPLGAAGLGVVTAVFYNFAPSFLARSVPAIWEVVSPADALAARSAGAVAALRAHVPEVPGPVLSVLRRIVEAAGWAGRPLGRRTPRCRGRTRRSPRSGRRRRRCASTAATATWRCSPRRGSTAWRPTPCATRGTAAGAWWHPTAAGRTRSGRRHASASPRGDSCVRTD